MRAHEILLEYNHEKTVRNFAELLGWRLLGYRDPDGEREQNYIDGHAQGAMGSHQFPHTPEIPGRHVIEHFREIDPTHGKFVLPMIRWYLSGDMRYLEDAAKLKGPIATYVKFRNRIKGIDIKKIAFRDFIEAMSKEEGTLSNAEADKEQEQGFYDRNEATLIYNDAEMKIVIPKTMAASCYFGRNTQWCTAARDKNDNMFNAYASDGPLFIILDKPNNRRWQFHFDLGGSITLRQISHQFMDETDSAVLPYDVMYGKPMRAIREWAREVDFEPLLDAMDDYDNEDADERGDAWTSMADEPGYDDDDEEEDDGQLELDLGDRRAA